jgi:TetR/AcrR family transcriptional regulator of autoinduction and epiphytic fitness
VQESAAPIDGRAARAARTRDAIIDATVALVEQGDVRPTAPRIAERAGVSVRSVFQHFDDLSAVYTAVVRRVVERVAVLVVPPDLTAPLDARIAAFVGTRGALLDAVTPFRRAANVHAPFSPELREALANGNAFLRAEVEAAFAPELDAMPASDRAELVAALSAASSWGTWDSLRVDGGESSGTARAVVARTLAALLSTAGR